MARMNALIPLQVDSPDIIGSLSAGNKLGRDVGLADLYRQHGEGIISGDANALNALARFDPAQALGVQGARQDMAAQSEMMGFRRNADARAQWNQEQAQQAIQTQQQLERAISAINSAQTPEQWDQLARTGGYDDLVGQFGNKGALLAQIVPLEEQLRMQIAAQMPPQPLSSAGKVQADINAGILPEGTPVQSGGVTVNNIPAGSQFGGKIFETRYEKILNEANSASEMDGMLDVAETALTSGLRTGFGAEQELQIRKFGQLLGLPVDDEKVAAAEVVKAIQNRMALQMRNPDSGMGMPGAVSDKDLTFLKDAQIGVDKSPEGNRNMLIAFRALNQRKKDVARLADEYVRVNGRLDIGFNEIVRRFAEENPMFTPDSFGYSSAGGGDVGAAALDFESDTPPPSLEGDDADLWQFATPQERELIWGGK